MPAIEEEVAQMLDARMTKFRVKKELLARGLPEEEVNLAVEAGWKLHERHQRRGRLKVRLVGLVLLVGGLAANAYTMFFMYESWGIAVGALLLVPTAGLLMLLAPD